jgi:hypothetical protein
MRLFETVAKPPRQARGMSHHEPNCSEFADQLDQRAHTVLREFPDSLTPALTQNLIEQLCIGLAEYTKLAGVQSEQRNEFGWHTDHGETADGGYQGTITFHNKDVVSEARPAGS